MKEQQRCCGCRFKYKSSNQHLISINQQRSDTNNEAFEPVTCALRTSLTQHRLVCTYFRSGLMTAACMGASQPGLLSVPEL